MAQLDDDWDDVRYVEHEGAEEWLRPAAGRGEFAKRLRAEAKASNRATRRFEQRFKSSHLKASPHAPAAAAVDTADEEAPHDVLRNLAFEDLEEQAELHTPETPQPAAQRTPINHSESRSRRHPHTPHYATTASTPTLCGSLMADRPSHWNTCPKPSRTPAPARASMPFQTPDSRIAKKPKAHTELIPNSLSTLKKRKRMPPSQGMSFRPSWLSQPKATGAVEEVVDDYDDSFAAHDDAEVQQPLLQHAASAGGTPQANRRRGRKGGELDTKLSRIRARLSRDHAAFRSGSADPSASTVLDVIHPRSRAKYAVDVTIVHDASSATTAQPPTSALAARELMALAGFVHRTVALKSNRGADTAEDHSTLHQCQYDGVHVDILMAAHDIRRHAIRPGAQLRFYDCVFHSAASNTRPLMCCTTLFESYREEFGILSEPIHLDT